MTDERATSVPAGRGPETEAGDALESAFAAARAQGDPAAPLPAGLMARLLAEAGAERPPAAAAVAGASAPAGGITAWLGSLFRPADRGGGLGWGAAGGIAACGLAGLWLGYAPPPALEGLTGGVAATVFADGDALATSELLAPLDGGLDGGLWDV
ncbi:dihydroorotate dehydrogenase [Rhodovulum sp. 12E13]|uniref:dihydroorotate dehydrogenase n=1 Tax=Rhodovulum sp. 12E13 TaxID=2203891 RepID=UPI001313E92D|nr:dihydroorotate dehydrogenase [Rhodovulum sp. 12E13]